MKIRQICMVVLLWLGVIPAGTEFRQIMERSRTGRKKEFA